MAVVHQVVGLNGETVALIVRRKVIAEHRLGPRQEKQIVLFLLRQALVLRELPGVRRVVEGLLQDHSPIVLGE